jgi:hypothetical protein
MTLLRALGRPVPKITKKYRLCWRIAEEACYVTVTADGSELVVLKPGERPFTHFVSGVCTDCTAGTECGWSECPRRNRKMATLGQAQAAPVGSS